jgi:hypothetical protein
MGTTTVEWTDPERAEPATPEQAGRRALKRSAA